MNVFKVRSDIGFIYFLKSFYFGVVEIVYAGEVSSKNLVKFWVSLLEVKVHSLF